MSDDITGDDDNSSIDHELIFKQLDGFVVTVEKTNTYHFDHSMPAEMVVSAETLYQAFKARLIEELKDESLHADN